MMRLQVLTTMEQLTQIRQSWEELTRHTVGATAWATPGAVLTWYQLVQPHSGIYVVAIWDNDRLVAVAPFSAVGLGPFRLLATAGAGFGYYGDPLMSAESAAASEYLAEHVSQMVASGRAAFYFRRILVDGPFLSGISRRHDFHCNQLSPDEPMSVVRFGIMDDPEQYLKAIARKHQVNRHYRRLRERVGDVEYLAQDPDPLVAMDCLREMQQRRFGEDLRIFETAQNRLLTMSLVEALLEDGNGRVSSLFAGGRRVAVAFIPFAGRISSWWAVAYEPELRANRIGHIEMYEAIRSSFESGASDVDLGDARFEYKARWANTTALRRTLVVTAQGKRGKVADTLRQVSTRIHRARRLERLESAGPHVI